LVKSTREISVALISMPWFYASMPSIQLAILKEICDSKSIKNESFEFYTDLVDLVGPNIYKALANDSGFAGELVFSQFYFENHSKQWALDLPHFQFAKKEIEEDVFRFIAPIIEHFLENCVKETDWSDYDIACFSLTATQTSPSLILAKMIKEVAPDIKIIFGGSSCAGEMGRAILEISDEVDVIVHGEAEISFAPLLRALSSNDDFTNIPGISYRSDKGLEFGKTKRTFGFDKNRPPLNFDSYFARIKQNGAEKWIEPWIPFETSRGCWYGEKVQCTFCGLDQIIKYRRRSSDGLISELSHYEKRYQIKQFFSVDLIMPQEFYKTVLPDIAEKDRDWSIFYEIKSNLKRQNVEALADAGIRWIQPGIESLSDEVLKIMKKGVSAAQNLQTLRWTKELGVLAAWNFLIGFPGEPADAYWNLCKIIPKLHHLDPPSGIGSFEVHRFSPFFDTPAKLGIELGGADHRYEYVYPLNADILQRLVYRHEFTCTEAPDEDLKEALAALQLVVKEWWQARDKGVKCTFETIGADEIVIADERGNSNQRYTLRGPEAVFFDFLDEMKSRQRVAELFQLHHPSEYEMLGGTSIETLIADWTKRDIALTIGNYVQILPIRRQNNVDQQRGKRAWKKQAQTAN